MSFSLRQIFQSKARPGAAYSEVAKVVVWNKARIIPGLPKETYRLDPCGAVIEWDQYGDITLNGKGWEIDYLEPDALHDTNYTAGLQAIHWQNNQVKGQSLLKNRAVTGKMQHA